VTTGASKYTLLAGTGKSDRLFSGVMATRMNACNLWNSSGRNSKGWTNE
jgi:hypothetical protein